MTTIGDKMSASASAGSRDTESASGEMVTLGHKLLLLWAHKTGQPPLSLLPKELLVIIIEYLSPVHQWNAATCRPTSHCENMTISHNGATVMFENKALQWITVLCTNPRRVNSYHKWRYRVDATPTGNIAVGVSAAPVEGGCFGLESSGGDTQWAFFGYPRYGTKRHSNHEDQWRPDFAGLAVGDEVDVVLHPNNDMEIVHKRQSLGIIYQNVNAPVVYGAMCVGNTGGMTLL
eukprot:TRINITY_DN5869_c1_g2_i1.p1 TRINITY_DN5869_c1_g2~~TRINITY_DN5869_c1_g2_i1.p1  ORF type:complete len:246 (-),score=39.70 TRINITY_DN5869_c1_g2_i1:69-767(-)